MKENTCILNKQDIYIGLYVDDLLIIVTLDQVNHIIDEIKVRFEVRIDKELKEFVGRELMIQDNKLILHQRKIILKLLQEFHPEIKILKFNCCPMGDLLK